MQHAACNIDIPLRSFGCPTSLTSVCIVNAAATDVLWLDPGTNCILNAINMQLCFALAFAAAVVFVHV